MVVDDNADLRAIVREALASAGFEVWAAASAREARLLVQQRGLPCLAVLDIGMPGVCGIELARSFKEFSDLPIIMLTAVADASTQVAALEEFAEDYVTKPVNLPVLVARVRRVLARIQDASFIQGQTIRVDDRLTVQLALQQVIVDGREVKLTPIEMKLMHILMRDAGRTVRTDFLLGRLWPLQETFEETLRVHVYRLRQKIEKEAKHPQYVLTMRGEGYRFKAFQAELEGLCRADPVALEPGPPGPPR
jgi:DNA-binding response OmpR family regulator